jgi:hypothetical protein
LGNIFEHIDLIILFHIFDLSWSHERQYRCRASVMIHDNLVFKLLLTSGFLLTASKSSSFNAAAKPLKPRELYVRIVSYSLAPADTSDSDRIFTMYLPGMTREPVGVSTAAMPSSALRFGIPAPYAAPRKADPAVSTERTCISEKRAARGTCSQGDYGTSLWTYGNHSSSFTDLNFME